MSRDEFNAVGRDGEVVRTPGDATSARPTPASRLETDDFRLEVGRANTEREFEVLVHIDGVEMTAAGAGMGMDPFDVFVPENRLVATPEPHQVPIARCNCGVYGCGSTDVVIQREGAVVHWDFRFEAPMRRGVTFPAAVYDAEVARLAADQRWQTPAITAARLVLETADRAKLAEHGLTLSWVAQDQRDPGRLQAALGDGQRYQVFVDVPLDLAAPASAADALVSLLAESPQSWSAQWHAILRGVDEPPPYTGADWTRYFVPHHG